MATSGSSGEYGKHLMFYYSQEKLVGNPVFTLVFRFASAAISGN